MLRVFALLAALMLTGCASQSLTHNYQGEVQLQSIRIEIAPLRAGEDEKKNGDLGKLTKLQKMMDSLDKAMDTEEQKKVEAQLKQFEQILVQGIREASGIPLVAADKADINMVYDDNAELIELRMIYPEPEGAKLNLWGNIYYGSKSELALGGQLMNTLIYEVKPVLNLQIEGRNAHDEAFWQTYVSHRASKTFRLSNDYILGVTPDEIENSDIFLIPLAKGIVKEIRKDLAK